MSESKQEQFIDWLCGKGKFPFFQDTPEVPYPDFYDITDQEYEKEKGRIASQEPYKYEMKHE